LHCVQVLQVPTKKKAEILHRSKIIEEELEGTNTCSIAIQSQRKDSFVRVGMYMELEES